MFKLRSWVPRSRLVFAAAALQLSLFSSFGAAPPSEDELKAVFIFHFTQFVRWPPDSLPETDAPFVIGVLDDDPFDAVLARMIRDEKVGPHPLELRHVSNREQVLGCHILYVPRESEQKFRAEKLQGLPVLTVGESDRFLLSGGIIAFFSERNHVGLRVNLEAARNAALNINAQLLRIAQVVEPSK